jgi:membrane dipeptidase
MTDQMIRDLASQGGVIQINFYPPFLNKDYADKFWPLCDEFEAAEALYKENKKKHEAAYNEALANMMALERPSYKEVVDHIDHVVKLVGVDSVGLGSDFDGIEVTPVGLEGVDKLPVITEELVNRGYSESDIHKILGGNFMRVMDLNF